MRAKVRAFTAALESVNHISIFAAIRRALALMIPLMIFGAFAVFINNIPNDMYQRFMLSVFGEGWKDFSDYAWQATFGIVALAVNISVGCSMVIHRKEKSLDIPPMMGSLVSLSCLFALTNFDGSVFEWLGAMGMFIALFTAIIAAELYLLLCRIRFLRINVFSNAGDSHLNAAISTLFPFLITLAVFTLAHVLFTGAGVDDIQASMYNAIGGIFTHSTPTLLTAILFQLMTQFSWFFGIHGNNAFISIENEILIPALEANIALAAQGLEPTEIVNVQFFNSFVYLGGSGAVLCLIAALFVAARRTNIRRIAAVGAIPALINVNEIILFGVPVILNFFLLIPMILVPVVLTLITYAAMAWGFVPLAIEHVHWTTPILISGYNATGGAVSGMVLQVFNLCVGIMLYMPFVRMYDHSLNRDNKRILSDLMATVMKLSDLRHNVLLTRGDAEGNMARTLAMDLRPAMDSGELMLFYQPLVDAAGSVFGAEALLRWNHPQMGYIPPPIVIAVAEEAGLIHDMGLWIFDTAVGALKGFRGEGLDIGISINVTPSQFDNKSLAADFSAMAARHGIETKLIEIEITEQMALSGMQHMQVINDIREAGFQVAIDDFGMGHGSLTYLKDLNLDVLKIDGMLIKEIETNNSCRDIISTITNLGKSMDIKIIAEFVENEQQRELLMKLGCTRYQGYLYSPALPYDKAVEYISNIMKKPAGAGVINKEG
jgi:lactose/cellobiose-specific phosphotransferase system IIC component